MQTRRSVVYTRRYGVHMPNFHFEFGFFFFLLLLLLLFYGRRLIVSTHYII